MLFRMRRQSISREYKYYYMEDGMYPRFFDRIRRKPLVETNGCDAHASLTSGLASQHESRKEEEEEPRKTSEAVPYTWRWLLALLRAINSRDESLLTNRT